MANPTSNFGWQMPTNTDLVKDLPADFEVFGQAVDTSLMDLKGGTTGQVLSKASNTDMDFTWTNGGDITEVTAGTGISGGGTSGAVTITNSMATAIDAKGDLIAGTGADTFSRLAVGTNGQFLQADSTTATGLKWAAAGSSFVGASVYNTSNQNVATATTVALLFNSEYFDSDNFHSTSTNTDRFTIPSGKDGKYLINAFFTYEGLQGGRRNIRLFKNGSTLNDLYTTSSGGFDTSVFLTTIVNAVAGDYFDIRAFQNSGGTVPVFGTSGYVGSNEFSIVYLGA